MAISVNKIGTGVSALLEDVDLAWNQGATGDLSVGAVNQRSIGAYTLGGAVSAASGSQGGGAAGAGAGSGSVNQIIGDTTAAVRRSTVVVPGAVTVAASDASAITAGAGAVAVAFASSGSSSAQAGAVGGSFAVNNIGTDGNPNDVWPRSTAPRSRPTATSRSTPPCWPAS